MTKRGILIVLFLAAMATACNQGTGGFAGKECEAKGSAQNTPEWRICVNAIYAHEASIAVRFRGGGP